MTGSINAAQWPRGHLELMQTLPSSAIPAYFVKRLHLRARPESAPQSKVNPLLLAVSRGLNLSTEPALPGEVTGILALDG